MMMMIAKLNIRHIEASETGSASSTKTDVYDIDLDVEIIRY